MELYYYLNILNKFWFGLNEKNTENVTHAVLRFSHKYKLSLKRI